MGEMAALREVQPHKSVTGIEDRHLHCEVGLGAGMGLHIGPAGSVESFETIDCELLDFVYHLAAAIVALAGIAFGVFVGADAAHCLEHFGRNIVFAGDELEAIFLAGFLLRDEVENLGVLFHDVINNGLQI